MPRIKRRRLRGSITQNNTMDRSKSISRWPDWAKPVLVYGGAVLIISLLIGYGAWLWQSGWPERQSETLTRFFYQKTRDSGFAVRDVLVEGRYQTSSADILASLGVKTGSAIFAFDPTLAHSRLMQLPWIEKAVVERRLPDKIYIQLTERKPVARWQREKKISLIDANGKELPDSNQPDFAKLPLLVGADANNHASTFLTILQRYPLITLALKAAVRVGERRWDLHLLPKTVAKLPENNLDAALERLARLIQDQRFLERNIATIDLRMLPDRIIIEENTPTASTAGKEDKP